MSSSSLAQGVPRHRPRAAQDKLGAVDAVKVDGARRCLGCEEQARPPRRRSPAVRRPGPPGCVTTQKSSSSSAAAGPSASSSARSMRRGVRIERHDALAARPQEAAEQRPMAPQPTTAPRPAGSDAAARTTQASGSMTAVPG